MKLANQTVLFTLLFQIIIDKSSKENLKMIENNLPD